MPLIRIVALQAKTYYRARRTVEEVMPVARAALDDIVDALTRPASAEERNPKPQAEEAPPRTIKVTAPNHELAVEKVNELFLENRWADGLPVVPPTEEAVKRMLAGTSRSPDEVIGAVAPKSGRATIEKIAINAVMAGAKPEYLPVIIAAMEGFTDKDYNLTHVQASTGSFIPAIIVTGPIAKELDFNSGLGFLGHGHQANSTVGRALRLCLLNLGHTWPAVNDMALIGRVSSYTFYTFAENQDMSPWEPYHVSLGYKPEDSTVTVSTVYQAFTVLGGGAVRLWTAQEILDRIVPNAVEGGSVSNQKVLLVLHPDCAAELAQMGYTRKKLQDWIYEQARIPYARLDPNRIKTLQKMIEDGAVPKDSVPAFREALREGGKVPVFLSAGDIHIFVAGGSPGYSLFFHYDFPAHQTRKVWGATLTKAGQEVIQRNAKEV